MENETVFYILGLSLTAMALIVSFLGLRMKAFPPSRPVQLAGVALFAVVVGGTATFAWSGAEDEQAHRDAEIAAGELLSPQEAQQEMIAASQEAEDEAEGEAPPEDGQTASVDGAAVFEEQGCGSCHTLEAAGSTGEVGPDLDTVLAREDEGFIETSIVDPAAEIEEGFGAVMPDDYETRLEPAELEALVQYIAESVGIKG